MTYTYCVFLLTALCGLSLTWAQCSLGNTSALQLIPDFPELGHITWPYEIHVSASVITKSNGSVLNESMSYLEYSKDKDGLVVECVKSDFSCIKRWGFNFTKKWLLQLDNNSLCNVINYAEKNASINIFVGGLLTTNNSNPNVTAGFRQLLLSFANLNATYERFNVSGGNLQPDVGTFALYKTCANFSQFNTSANVEIYVQDQDQASPDYYRPYLVRINLQNIDNGTFYSGNASNKLVNVTITLYATYSSAVFASQKSLDGMAVPDDVYCNWPNNSKNVSWPSASSLSFTLEESIQEDQVTFVRREAFSKDDKIWSRSFFVPDQAETSNYAKFNRWISSYSQFKGQLHIVHDFREGVEWQILPDEGKCGMQNISTVAPDVVLVNGSLVQMVEGFQSTLFGNFSSNDFGYYGESTFRGIPVSVFGAQKCECHGAGTHSVFKFHFASGDWQFATAPSVKNPLVGVQIFVFDNSTGNRAATYQGIVTDLSEKNGDMVKAFYQSADFGTCAAKSDFYSLAFNDSTKAVCGADMSQFITKFGDLLANASSVERIRLGSVSLACLNGSVVDVSFRIIDRLNQSLTKGNVAGAQFIFNVTEAIDNLNKSVTNGSLSFKTGEKNLPAMALRLSSASLTLNTSETVVVNKTSGGYTPSSMAGLAFAMLAVGALIALICVYFYQRRRNAQFSYMVQE